jgi:hypothetical protein
MFLIHCRLLEKSYQQILTGQVEVSFTDNMFYFYLNECKVSYFYRQPNNYKVV